MRSLVFILAFLLFTVATAQDKIEIEKGVKQEEVPSMALKNLSKILDSDQKIKWFYQEDGSKEVYEAKFKLKSKKYSVEFDPAGTIYNVEIDTKTENFSKKDLKALNKNLEKLFDDYKIRKIQIEYLGEEDDLYELIEEQEEDDDLEVQYELEVDAKTSQKRLLYEVILNSKFELISQRKIILQSTDILDY